MEHVTQTDGTSAAMRRETLDELMLLVYHPRHASDPERPLRFARAFLGRPGLTHATLPAIGEDEAVRLIPALSEAFPDRTAEIVARTTRDLLDRPS